MNDVKIDQIHFAISAHAEVLVIGGGAAGLTAAIGTRQAGV
jgi:heterodisulfide reductase subunit A-like polyferredoxin